MGRKKRKLDLEIKPFCYYCDREFSDEKVLLQHQKAKHFKCLICDRKLDLANSLAIHTMQVHKSNLKAVPNSLPKRSNPELNIRGMSGVPTELIEENLNKLKQKINAFNVKRQQRVNNSLKKQRMTMMDPQCFPFNQSPPNYYSAPSYAYQPQPNMMQYPDSFQNASFLNRPNDGTHVPAKNINMENAKEMDEVNNDGVLINKEKCDISGHPESKNDIKNKNENKNEKEIDTKKAKNIPHVTQNQGTLNDGYESKTITSEELAKSSEKMTLNLMDPLNIFEDIPIKLPMFSSNAQKYESNEEKHISPSFLPPYIPSNTIDILAKPHANMNSSRVTPPVSSVPNKENPVANTRPNNITTPGISSVPPPPPCPPTSVISHNVPYTPHSPVVHLGRHVRFIPPPPASAPTNTHMQPHTSFMPTAYQTPTPLTPPPPPVVPSVSSLPTTHHSTVHSAASAHISNATTTPLPRAVPTPIYFASPSVTSGPNNITSVPPPSEFASVSSPSITNTCLTNLSPNTQEQNIFPIKSGNGVQEEAVFSHWHMVKDATQKDSHCNEADNNTNTYLYNNSKAKIIQLNLPPPTDISPPPQEDEFTLFYNEVEYVYRVKAMREFGWVDAVAPEKTY